VRTVRMAVFRGARPVELGMVVTVSMSRIRDAPVAWEFSTREKIGNWIPV
jgi:hypothetical protein